MEGEEFLKLLRAHSSFISKMKTFFLLLFCFDFVFKYYNQEHSGLDERSTPNSTQVSINHE